MEPIVFNHYTRSLVFKWGEETINKLRRFLRLRLLNDIKLHVKEFSKRVYHVVKGNKEYHLSVLVTRKTEIIEILKNIEYNNLEDMVYRMLLTYDEIMDTLDIKYLPSKRTGYTLPIGMYEISNINKTLELILPNNMKVNTTIDVSWIGSNLNLIETLILTQKSFFPYNIRVYSISFRGSRLDRRRRSIFSRII